jgi:adenosylcobinamide amidohydrolase
VEPVLAGDLMLRVDLGSEHRCLASTVLGGGLGAVRTWVNLQVPSDYARTDPGAHLMALTATFPGPVVGMLTAAAVERFQDVSTGSARAFATVGLGHPIAAAGIREPLPWTRPGTINIFVVTEAPLTDAGLVGALQTAVEAKVQALTEAGIGARNVRGLATGTASDAIAIACAPGASVAFAGPATEVGHDLARAVWEAVSHGCRTDIDGVRHGG